ncbi:MAG: class I SAM-dependent methyltransferase [Acidobacteriota bacterium]
MTADDSLFDRQYRELRSGGRKGWADDTLLERAQQRTAAVLAWDEVPRGGRLLDLGCGEGRKALWLARRGWEVTGVDLSPTAIAWARENAESAGLPVDFRVGSVLDLAGLADDSFDLVHDGNCAHCIVGDDRAALLASVRRVLSQGGVFLLNAMSGELPAGFAGDYDPESRCLLRDGKGVRFIGEPDSLRAELTTAGFELLRDEVFEGADGTGCDLFVAVARRA